MHQSQRAPIRLGWREALQCMGSYTHTHKHAHKIALSERMLGVQLLNTQILRWWYDLLRAGQIMEMYVLWGGFFVKATDSPPPPKVTSSLHKHESPPGQKQTQGKQHIQALL